MGFMNQDWVQRDLGVPLNFSIGAVQAPGFYFGVTGDPIRVTIDNINHVARSGIKVALVYGDRDYRCNCESNINSPREIYIALGYANTLLQG